jgi:NADPH oxidase 1
MASGEFSPNHVQDFRLNSSQFTITSAPEDPYVSIHIRQVGDWTKALGERVGAGPSVVQQLTQSAMKAYEKDEKNTNEIGRGDFIEIDPNSSTRPLPIVRIDGPYGAPAEDVFTAEVAVLVGAGIGLSPPSFYFISADDRC